MIELSDDPSRLDVALVTRWLAGSYWSPGISRAAVERQIAGSHCLGAYCDGAQIGFARCISDRASFGWIADVFVDEGTRGAGIGRRLVAWFLDHRDYATVRRFGLVTGDAHGVYEPLGFHAPLRPERHMERLHPDTAARLRAAP